MSEKNKMQNEPPSVERFRAQYSGKQRERFNKAIRHEIPGGAKLLETMTLVHSVIHRVRNGGRIDNSIDLLQTLMDQLVDSRSEMVKALRKKYKMPPSERGIYPD